MKFLFHPIRGIIDLTAVRHRIEGIHRWWNTPNSPGMHETKKELVALVIRAIAS